jgi:hypothetical protein
MTNAADGDIYRLILHWTIHAQNAYNVLHFKAFGTPSIETDLQTGMQTTFTSGSANAHFSSDLVLADMAAIRMYPSLSPSIIKICGNPGVDSNDSIPSTCSIVAQIRTATGGRRARCRFYVPGIARVFIADSKFTAAGWTWLQNITASFITPSTGNRWTIGCLSRVDGGSHAPINPAGFRVATSLTFDPVVATMRKRRIGRGR